MVQESVERIARFGEGFYSFAMRGRQRVASREYIHGHDKEENSASVRLPNAKPSWRRSLQHVIVASLSSFLYGYHVGVVNETLESISIDLGFSGNTLAEGLVVSICLGGAFIGSLFSGWIADGVGRRRSFQLCALPMIIGAGMSATSKTLWGMLLGRLFVGTGMGLGPPVAALYVAEVSPPAVRGTFGGLTQIATCLGLMGSLFIGIPAKDIVGWWRICFWVSVIPAAILALFMEICAESPYWLFKRGRTIEAEAEFEKLLGGLHVKSAMSDLSKSDRGDESGTLNLSDIFYGRHSRVLFIGSALFALQQLSGINAVFYFSSAVFESFGVPSDIANTCVGIVNLLGSVVSMILMDKLGRKILLLGSFLGMAVSMGLQVIAASSFVKNSIAFFSTYLFLCAIISHITRTSKVFGQKQRVMETVSPGISALDNSKEEAKVGIDESALKDSTEAELTKIRLMRASVESRGDPSAKEVDDLMIRRFLRARDLDVEKASAMFLKYLKWKHSFVPNGSISPSEIVDDIAQEKMYVQGVDKKGRPITVAFAAKHFQNKNGLDSFKRYVVFALGKLCSRMPAGQEKFLAIADIKGWSYTNSDLRGYLNALTILQDYHPERLGKLFIVHAPYMFMKVWKVVYPFIDDNTKKKIVFVETKKLKSTLLEEIDESQLPDIYGGQLPLVPIQDC